MILKDSVREIMEETIRKVRKGESITKDMFGAIRKKISGEISKNIERGTVEFIRGNINHLPMYYIPGEEFDWWNLSL